MKNNIIQIISFYDYDKINENRVSSVAAINKINYIASSLKNKYNVKIISPAWTNNKKFYFGREIKIDDNIVLKSFFTIPWINILKPISFIISNIQLIIYLLFNTKKNENIIIYHSRYFIYSILVMKKIKKFKIMLEVEEIYSDTDGNKKLLKKENKIFNSADKYIFITKLLERKINNEKKPYCIVHGTYKVEKQIVNKYSDNRIHIVYSGIIDKLKKGAFMTCDLSQYLDENYYIHIIGFGKNEDINELKETIDVNNQNNKCKIVYDGLKRGEEYIKYIQKCHIGLSTQDPTEKYNETSFPSKILAYLSNGLKVITINIPAIKTSDVSSILYYYQANDSKEIADVIKKININDTYDSRKLIIKLDEKFTNSLMEVLDE